MIEELCTGIVFNVQMFWLKMHQPDEITEAQIHSLAVVAVANATDAVSLLVRHELDDAHRRRRVFLDALAYLTCVIELRAQSRYSFKTADELALFLMRLRRAFTSLPSQEQLLLNGTPVALPPWYLTAAASPEFADLLAAYAGRDIDALGLSKQDIEYICGVAGLAVPSSTRDSIQLLTIMLELRVFEAVSIVRGSNIANANAFARAVRRFRRACQTQSDRVFITQLKS